MHDTATHRSAVELEQGIAEVLASPKASGRLAAIVVRPRPDERQTLSEANLTPTHGIDGDRWVRDSYYKLKDGGSDPRCQISLMNVRILRQLAGDDDSMCLAGDNLIVDLDLGEENLPAGSMLTIGDNVLIELSDLPHTGCGKFAKRYGDDARAFVNNERGRALHLRGRYARIIHGGTIRVGDYVTNRATT